MSSEKMWTVRVTDLGGNKVINQITVAAAHWLSALDNGRQGLGLGEGMPPGASCAVDDLGNATVHDPTARHTYHVKETPEGESVAGSPTAATAPAKEPSASYVPPPPRKALDPNKARKKNKGSVSSRTVAYGMTAVTPEALEQAKAAAVAGAQEVGAEESLADQDTTMQDPQPQETGPEETGPEAPRTNGVFTETSSTEGLPADLKKPEPPAETESSEARQVDEQPAARERLATDPDGAPFHQEDTSPDTPAPWAVLKQRDSDPTEQNPLTYRERSYWLPDERDAEALESFLRQRFVELRDELESEPPGKFFNLAVFDHEWTDRPEREPLATLAWKDWRGEAEVAFSQRSRSAPRLTEARWSAPPSQTSVPLERTDPPSVEHDIRLMRAFEASQDLLFLKTPIEGMEFIVRLLEELVPCQGVAGCLYDINTDELRFVASVGPGGNAQQGKAVARAAGLMALAVRQPGVVLNFKQLDKEARFDPAVDGRDGLESKNALYCALAQQGHLLGVLQLQNRQRRAAFTEGDMELLNYVSKQMSKFLQAARTSLDARAGA